MRNYAPILLFTYARLFSLKRLVTSIKRNKGFYNHELFIFSDGPKNKKDKKQINKVRKYIKSINGFKKITIFKNKRNLGTAKSIINGVNKIIKIKKMAIILEDDLILNKNFLDYMNNSLKKYEHSKKVWHISGWNYNFNFKINSSDAFFSRHMMCWGWATWYNKWRHFKKEPKRLIKNWTKKKIKKFNLDDSYDFWSQVIRNNNKKINTWAIFWYATIFENKGLCLYPKSSLVLNLGNDRFAVNTQKNSIINNRNFKKNGKIKVFPRKVQENETVFKTIKSNLKPNIFKKIINRIKDDK